MKQFVIIARDGKDPAALERRMAARSAHLAGAGAMKGEDQFIIGGAMLDEQGQMNGSVMIVQFEDEAALQEWLRSEPYLLGDVWREVEIRPFRVADV